MQHLINTPKNKELSLNDMVSCIRNGMTLAIGGWGGRRKPMAFVRALVKSDVRDLTVLSYAGCDVGLLIAAGKVRKLIFSFATLDASPIEPHFRLARQAGQFECMEIDEGMLQTGLKAGAARLSFLPTRAGMHTGVLEKSPSLKTVKSPYEDGEEYVAMPALRPDVAVCHVNKADRSGNSWIYGPDPFFDEWFCRAADKSYLTCEEIVDTSVFASPDMALRMPIERSLVAGVAHTPLGAHPTSCAPAYGIDRVHLDDYCASAGEKFSAYCEKYLALDEAEYIMVNGGRDRIQKLPLPGF